MEQITESIVHFITQAPNLAHRCFWTYSLRKVRSPLEKNKMDPIFQDGRQKNKPFVVVLDNRGSDRLDTGHWTTCEGVERVCRIWSWWGERFLSYVDYRRTDTHRLCAFIESRLLKRSFTWWYKHQIWHTSALEPTLSEKYKVHLKKTRIFKMAAIRGGFKQRSSCIEMR